MKRDSWLRRAIPFGVSIYSVLLALLLRSGYAVPLWASLSFIGLPMLILVLFDSPLKLPSGEVVDYGSSKYLLLAAVIIIGVLSAMGRGEAWWWPLGLASACSMLLVQLALASVRRLER